MENSKTRGRPRKPVYPDYLKSLPTDVVIAESDEVCHGFPDKDLSMAEQKKRELQNIIKTMESQEEEPFYGFSSQEIDRANDKKRKIRGYSL